MPVAKFELCLVDLEPRTSMSLLNQYLQLSLYHHASRSRSFPRSRRKNNMKNFAYQQACAASTIAQFPPFAASFHLCRLAVDYPM